MEKTINNKTKKLLEAIDDAMAMSKDYNTLDSLLSDDDGIVAMANMRKSVGKVRTLLELSQIKDIGHPTTEAIRTSRRTGSLVKVRPCAEKYQGKTYIGILIGDVATGSSISVQDDKIICEWSRHNPGIIIPEFGDIVYGMESWWGVIEKEEDLKDVDPESVWYVKALKHLGDVESEEKT